MKIGVIGAGAWGRNIVRTLDELDALGAVAEPSTETRAKLAVEYPGTRLYENAEEILSNHVPAVAIATPAPTHFELAKQALLNDKDVFVEKPLTMCSAQAKELCDLADERSRVIMTGHLLLFQPAITFIADAIQKGMIGQLLSLHQERLNLGRARAQENVLWSLGVHDIAVLLELVGEEPTDVTAAGQDVLTSGVEDDMYLHLTFASGVRAHLHSSWLWPERRRLLTVVGNRGMLVYDELAQNVTLHRKSIDNQLQNVDEGAEVVFEGAGEPLKLELEHFLDSVASRSEPRSSGRSALAVLRVLERAGGKS